MNPTHNKDHEFYKPSGVIILMLIYAKSRPTMKQRAAIALQSLLCVG